MKKALLFLLTTAIGFAQINVTSADYVQQGKLTSIADAGANDTYTGCPTVAVRAYATGMEVAFKPNTVNTGAASLNVCSLGAKSIKTVAGADPSDGDLAAGKWYKLVYDGTNFQIIGGSGGSTSPGGSSGQVQINSGGSFAGRTLSGFTDNTTNLVPDGTILGELGGNNTWVGHNYYPASATQSKTAVSDTITCDRVTVAVSPTSDLTLTSAPTIADGTNGQLCTITNVGSFALTIQDQDTLASSNLQLASSTVTIPAKGQITLQYSSTVGEWIQYSGSGGSSTASTSERRIAWPAVTSGNATDMLGGQIVALGYGAGVTRVGIIGTANTTLAAGSWRFNDTATGSTTVTSYLIVRTPGFPLNSTLTSNISNLDVKILVSKGTAWNGTAKFRVEAHCPALDTAVMNQVITWTSPSWTSVAGSTSNVRQLVTFSNVLSGLTCGTNNDVVLKIARGTLDGESDTETGDLDVTGVWLDFTR